MLTDLRSGEAWGRSARLWLLTVLFGSLCFLPLLLSVGQLDGFIVLVLAGGVALVASAPTVLLNVLLFGWVSRLPTLGQRWWLAASGILLLFGGAVLAAQASVSVGSLTELMRLLTLPYLLAALLVAWRVYPCLRRSSPVPPPQPQRQLAVGRLLVFGLLMKVLTLLVLPLLHGRVPLGATQRAYLFSPEALLRTWAPSVLMLPFVGYLLSWAAGWSRRSQRLTAMTLGFVGINLLSACIWLLPMLTTQYLSFPTNPQVLVDHVGTSTAVYLAAALPLYWSLLLRPDEPAAHLTPAE